jgi:hypothetical protein
MSELRAPTRNFGRAWLSRVILVFTDAQIRRISSVPVAKRSDMYLQTRRRLRHRAIVNVSLSLIRAD